MTIWGIGPRLFLFTALVMAPLVGLRMAGYGDAWLADTVPRVAIRCLGGLLLVIGVPILVLAARTIRRGFRAGRLCTTGPYAWCRHPLYATWILLVIPGGLLAATGDPLSLVVPLVMGLLFRFLIGAEERWLEETFGEEYRLYRGRTNLLLPWPPRS